MTFNMFKDRFLTKYIFANSQQIKSIFATKMSLLFW